VDKFAIIRSKYQHEEKYIQNIIQFIMALSNIYQFEDIVRSKVFNLDYEEWDDWLADKRIYLQEEIVMIENEVFKFLNF
jgi:hypothetical protein